MTRGLLFVSIGVAAVGACLVACGASCPAPTATRGGLAAPIAAPHLRIELRGNQLAQMNEKAAALSLSWADPVAAELTIYDAANTVRLTRSLPPPAGAISVPLADEAGKSLAAGIYRVELVAGSDRASQTFEICHCTVYY